MLKIRFIRFFILSSLRVYGYLYFKHTQNQGKDQMWHVKKFWNMINMVDASRCKNYYKYNNKSLLIYIFLIMHIVKLFLFYTFIYRVVT